MRPAVALVLAGLAACVTGTPRPLPPSADFPVDAAPAGTVAAVLRAVSDQGLPLQRHDDVRGEVETSYVDIAEYQPSASMLERAERLVRFRIMVVPAETGYGSRVVIEARYSPFAATGQIERRRERAVPRDHPAMQLVRELEEAITDHARS